MTLVALAIACAPELASAQTPEPISARSTDARAPRPATKEVSIPSLVAALPGSTPLVLYTPRLATSLADTSALLGWLATVEPSFENMTSAHLFAQLWGARLPASVESVATPAGLAKIGIDTEASAAFVLDHQGRSVVVVFGLSSRKRFEAWLSKIEGQQRRRIKIAGEEASVLSAATDAPVICIARLAHAYCQFGETNEADPTGPLKRLLHFEGPTLGAPGPRRDALMALEPGAHLYASASPTGIANILGRGLIDHARAQARFHDPLAKKALVGHAHTKASQLARMAGYVQGAASGVYPKDAETSLQTEVLLSHSGRRFISGIVPDGEPDQMIARWAETPALFRMVTNGNPALLHALAEDLGFELPTKALTGTLAMLILGVDAECPTARKHQKTAGPWPFFMPSAVAVGVRSADMADQVHASLRAVLDEQPSANVPSDRPALIGDRWGGSFEVTVLDDMMLIGAGRGSGAAALRRLGTLPAPRRVRTTATPFLRANVDLRAIDAAFASGAFGIEHRAELLAAEAFRLQMKPLLTSVGSVAISATKHANGQRISLQARTSR